MFFTRTTCCSFPTHKFRTRKKRGFGTDFQPNGWNAFFPRTACCSLLYHEAKMFACMQIVFALAFFAMWFNIATVLCTEWQSHKVLLCKAFCVYYNISSPFRQSSAEYFSKNGKRKAKSRRTEILGGNPDNTVPPRLRYASPSSRGKVKDAQTILLSRYGGV